MQIDVKILDERMRERMPAYATPGSAGLDLRALLDEPLVINPGETVLVRTGLTKKASCSAISLVSSTATIRAS